MRAIFPDNEHKALDELVNNFMRASTDVFILCACTHAEVDLTSVSALKERFGPQARRIAQVACKLARVTKEEIMSTNFEVVLAQQSRPFDEKLMVNAFGAYGDSTGVVLCTTELGLQCTTRRDTKEVTEGLGETIECQTLLQPKVILDSVAEVLLQTGDQFTV